MNPLIVAMGYAEVYRSALCQVYWRELEEAESKASRDRARVDMRAEAGSYECQARFL